jgi:hypothetical protein
VNIADLGVLAAHWQQGAGGMSFGEAMGRFDTFDKLSASLFDGVVVPEPGAVGLLGMVGVMVLRRRRWIR